MRKWQHIFSKVIVEDHDVAMRVYQTKHGQWRARLFLRLEGKWSAMGKPVDLSFVKDEPISYVMEFVARMAGWRVVE